MGIASGVGLLTGSGNVSAPKPAQAGQAYSGLLSSYLGGSSQVFQNQATYQPQYNELSLSELASSYPEIANILNGGAGGVTNLVNGINPGQTNLLNSMTRDATAQLNSGADLDPQLQRLFQQSIRGSQAARGLGYGPSDAFNESLGLTQFGNDLRTQREQYAGNVAGMNNSYITGNVLPLLTNILGAAGTVNQTSGPSLAPPASTMQLLTMPYQAMLQAKTSTAGNNTGLYQSADSNSTSFFNNLISTYGGSH